MQCIIMVTPSSQKKPFISDADNTAVALMTFLAKCKVSH